MPVKIHSTNTHCTCTTCQTQGRHGLCSHRDSLSGSSLPDHVCLPHVPPTSWHALVSRPLHLHFLLEKFFTPDKAIPFSSFKSLLNIPFSISLPWLHFRRSHHTSPPPSLAPPSSLICSYCLSPIACITLQHPTSLLIYCVYCLLLPARAFITSQEQSPYFIHWWS